MGVGPELHLEVFLEGGACAAPPSRAPLVVSAETLRARTLIEHRDQRLEPGWGCRC
jgi:hypothetical protein